MCNNIIFTTTKAKKSALLCADSEDLKSLDWTLHSLMEPGGQCTADCSGGVKVAWMKGGLEKKERPVKV